MKNKFLGILLGLCLALPSYSQILNSQSILDNTSIGIKAGVNTPFFRYSNANLREYNKSVFLRKMFGFLAEVEINPSISVRPEFVFIGKGEKIEDLGVSYQMKSNYFEFRLPVVYNYNELDNLIPYAFVGPAFSMATGGNIAIDGYSTDLTKANLSSFDVEVLAGLGVKYPLTVANIPMKVAAEITYAMGFSDSYSAKEKNESAIALNRRSYTIDGTRKNRSFGLNFSVLVPLSGIFKQKEKIEPQIVTTTIPQIEQKSDTANKIPEKSFYTISEIKDYLNKGLEVNTLKISLFNINFDTKQYAIKEESKPYLDEIVSLLNSVPSMKFKINGHTDNVGDDDNNLVLSRNRAKAVLNYLVSKGIAESRLVSEGFGETKPIDTNDTEEGRLNNRRVEFEIIEE